MTIALFRAQRSFLVVYLISFPIRTIILKSSHRFVIKNILRLLVLPSGCPWLLLGNICYVEWTLHLTPNLFDCVNNWKPFSCWNRGYFSMPNVVYSDDKSGSCTANSRRAQKGRARTISKTILTAIATTIKTDMTNAPWRMDWMRLASNVVITSSLGLPSSA